jgi:gas vesicle protein
MSENRSCSWITGLFVGGLVGAVAGLLFAPMSGKDTREEISDKAKRVSKRLKKEYDTTLEKSRDACEDLMTRFEKLEARAEKKAKEIGKSLHA